MEPITTAWILAAMLSGWLGNRTDFWLCKGANNIYDRITNRLNEPANQHIQRAVRKSYLQATLMAVNHLLKDHNTLNLKDIKNYLKEELQSSTKEDTYIPQSVLDAEHREILFPKEVSSQERMPDLIVELKLAIISELKRRGYTLPEKLKTIINEGWKVNYKEYDFYDLVAAFFTQELNENTQLATYIQTEYLDHIAKDAKELKVEFADLKIQLEQHYEKYKEILPKLDDLLKGQEDIKEQIADLKMDVLQKLDEAIENKHISSISKVTISKDYQSKLRAIKRLTDEIKSLQTQISGLEDLADKETTAKETLEQTIKHLNKQLFEKFEAKRKQEDALNEFVKQVINLAKQLNETKGINSTRLEKARALFAEGKFAEIVNLLNEEEIDKDIKAYEERGKILANELTIKAQAIVVNKAEGWFNEANRFYTKAMTLIENYNTTFNYAYFLQIHEQILKAAEIYEKSLNYVSDDNEKASILNNLGALQHRKSEFDQSEKSYAEALEIRRKLADINPQTYLPYVAQTLNNLGLLQRAKNEFGQAENSFVEALEIYRKLAKANPQTYLPIVAMNLNNLANLQGDKNEFDQAQNSFVEALEIFQKLADINLQTYLPYVAMTLNNLGLFKWDKNELEQAEKSFIKALGVYRKLADINPQTYLLYIAGIFDNLGLLQSDKNELEQAKQSYAEALEIYRKLSAINPQTYLPYVATTLNNLGLLQSDTNEFEQAGQSYQEALQIREKLSEENPNFYETDLAVTYLCLSNLYRFNIINKDKSKFYANKSLELYKKYWNKVSHAKKGSDDAQQILDYWQSQEDYKKG